MPQTLEVEEHRPALEFLWKHGQKISEIKLYRTLSKMAGKPATLAEAKEVFEQGF
jgi:hypothetical protein